MRLYAHQLDDVDDDFDFDTKDSIPLDRTSISRKELRVRSNKDKSRNEEHFVHRNNKRY